MAATVKGYAFNGSGPTATDADSADAGSIKFGRDDVVVSTVSVPIPTAAGTKWSYLKYVGLDVTVAGATTISNRKVSIASAITAGLAIWWAAQKTYTQNTGTQETGIGSSTAGNYPKDDGTNNISGITAAKQAVAAPTATLNGAHSAGVTALTVNSGGTGFQNGQYLLVGANTANAEIVQANGSPTATSIPVTATANTHATADVVGLGYKAATTTPVQYDNASVSSAGTGINGAYLQLVFAVDNTFTGGGGAATLPNLVLNYDEQ